MRDVAAADRRKRRWLNDRRHDPSQLAAYLSMRGVLCRDSHIRATRQHLDDLRRRQHQDARNGRLARTAELRHLWAVNASSALAQLRQRRRP